MPHAPQIPLGARGTVRGRKYECIGFMVRSDQSGDYPWEEYLLFNPYYGFRWLMTMNGHWNFISPVFLDYPLIGDPLPIQGQTYRLFLRDVAVVRFVLGEFYWQVKVGDVAKVREYISPPYTVSGEDEGFERNCSFAEYIDRTEVAESFSLNPASFPAPTGIFPNQPSPYHPDRFFMWLGSAVFLIGILLSAATLSRKEELVTAIDGTAIPGVVSAPIITETFEFLDDGNLQFQLEGPVSNSWLDVDISIVNAANQSSLDTSAGISYYFGYEDGEGWTEGGTRAVTTVGDIERGRYYFTIQAEASAEIIPRPVRFNLQIIRHGAYWDNLLLAIVLGLLPALYNLIAGWHFESQRWETSTESPQSDDS